MADEHPEDRRAARLAAMRAQRGTEERQRQIADLEARRAAEPKPVQRARTTTTSYGARGSGRSSSTPRPRGGSGKTAGTSFFGHPWSEWHRMVDVGHDLLVEHATAGVTTTEGELWKHIGAELDLTLGDPRLPVPFLLRDITNRQFEETGLVLTALVVGDQETPTPGFFRLAAQVGTLQPAQAPPESTDDTWTMTDQQAAFWRQQVEALFALHGEGGAAPE